MSPEHGCSLFLVPTIYSLISAPGLLWYFPNWSIWVQSTPFLPLPLHFSQHAITKSSICLKITQSVPHTIQDKVWSIKFFLVRLNLLQSYLLPLCSLLPTVALAKRSTCLCPLCLPGTHSYLFFCWLPLTCCERLHSRLSHFPYPLCQMSLPVFQIFNYTSCICHIVFSLLYLKKCSSSIYLHLSHHLASNLKAIMILGWPKSLYGFFPLK